MTREELLKSSEHWTLEIQLQLFKLIEKHLEENKVTRIQFAENLGVSKGYVSQILNGEFDHRISKLVELSLSIGKVPRIIFDDLDYVLEEEKKSSSKFIKTVV
ncbi:MAG: helix-turn-helix transcriptional regulator [Candidatus Kapabacteria bacterium]|nr:helix-turn-helix transcriptional regulator [Candidatus Kapabacteria bacterium]